LDFEYPLTELVEKFLSNFEIFLFVLKKTQKKVVGLRAKQTKNLLLSPLP
jgi:hypothetical protein